LPEAAVSIERMLLALELLLVRELAARRRDAILRLDVDRVGSGRLGLAAGQHTARRARGIQPRHEAFEVTLLVGGKVAGHVTPPIAWAQAAYTRQAPGRRRDRRGCFLYPRRSGSGRDTRA